MLCMQECSTAGLDHMGLHGGACMCESLTWSSLTQRAPSPHSSCQAGSNLHTQVRVNIHPSFIACHCCCAMLRSRLMVCKDPQLHLHQLQHGRHTSMHGHLHIYLLHQFTCSRAQQLRSGLAAEWCQSQTQPKHQPNSKPDAAHSC
jgi:hypothetical protein